MSRESTPLLKPSAASGRGHAKSNSGSNYYFLNKPETETLDKHAAEVLIEPPPEGTTEDEFAPRLLSQENRHPSHRASNASNRSSGRPGHNGFFGWWMGHAQHKPKSNSSRPYGDVGTLPKLRKAPIKIEPKVFFANERTFLAWMHLSVILAGASIAILAFAQDDNPYNQLYGVVLLPVAISFIVYSMYQYTRRAYMIRNRHPGPYEDTVGPTVLGIMLMVSIVAQFAMKLYALSE